MGTCNVIAMLFLTELLYITMFNNKYYCNSSGILGTFEKNMHKEVETLKKINHSPFLESVRYKNVGAISAIIVSSTNKTYNDYISELVPKIFTSSTLPLIIFTEMNDVRNHTNCGRHTYLIISPDLYMLQDYLKKHKAKHVHCKCELIATFLILIVFPINDNVSTSTVIFDLLWKDLHFLDIFIFVTDKKEAISQIIITHDPFLRENQLKDNLRTISLSELKAQVGDYCERVRNLNGYNVNVIVFNDAPSAIVTHKKPKYLFSGRDDIILADIANYMNFTPVFKIPYVSAGSRDRVDRSMFTNGLKYLSHKRADIIGNEINMKYYDNDEITFLLPVLHSQDIVIVVPKSRPSYSFLVVFKGSKFYHYQFFVITFICCVIVWNSMKNLRFISTCDKYSYLQNLIASFLEMLGIFITMPVYLITRIRISSQRVFLASCLMSSWILIYSFQGLLLGIVSNPQYSQNINTLEELKASGMDIFTSHIDLLDIFNNSRKLEPLSSKITYMNAGKLSRMVKKNKNISLVTSKTTAKRIVNVFRGHRAMHIMEETPISYYISYMIHKCSPFSPRLRILLGRIAQAGLVQKLDAYDHDNDSGMKDATEDESDQEVICSLGLPDVLIAFLFLLIGLCLCIVVFILELLFK